MAKSKNPHTLFVKQLDAFLKLQSQYCYGWKNNTGGVLIKNQFVKYGHKGSSDWIGLTRDGKMLCFEAKTGDARQTYDQRRFQEEVTKRGGRYFIIRSMEHLEQIWTELVNLL